MSEQLSSQQQMVLDEQRLLLSRTTDTGIHLDGKAATILQAGGLIIALVGATSLPAFVYAPVTIWQKVALAAAFLAFLGMVLAALRAWRPSEFASPGTLDWNELFTDYIYQDIDTCYEVALNNLLETTRHTLQRNQAKAKWVNISVYLFGLQIAAVLALALATAG